MTIQEIIERINYHNSIIKERENCKSRDFYTLLTHCIGVGYNYGKSGKKNTIKSWENTLNNIFSNKEKKEINIEKEIRKLEKVFG